MSGVKKEGTKVMDFGESSKNKSNKKEAHLADALLFEIIFSLQR